MTVSGAGSIRISSVVLLVFAVLIKKYFVVNKKNKKKHSFGLELGEDTALKDVLLNFFIEFFLIRSFINLN